MARWVLLTLRLRSGFGWLIRLVGCRSGHRRRGGGTVRKGVRLETAAVGWLRDGLVMMGMVGAVDVAFVFAVRLSGEAVSRVSSFLRVGFAKYFFRVLEVFEKIFGGPPAPAPARPQFKGVFSEKQGGRFLQRGRFWLVCHLFGCRGA